MDLEVKHDEAGGKYFAVVDLLSGARHDWRVGGNYLRLPPGGAHILAMR